MIDQLITALSKEVGLSAEEIADTIWLALYMGEAELISSDFPFSQEDEAGINNRDSKETFPKLQPEISDSQATGRNQPTEEQKAGIYPRTQNQTSTGSDLFFKVPDAPSLREPLTLARALKPLMRRIPSGTTLVLDEAATIQRIADEGLWLPVLRPTLEPWLDLELVVDESISMQIWRHTIRDLERLLKNYGIFRDVRVWGLIADEQEQVQIRRGIGATAKNQPLRSPAELIDPSGRRLVLVVSDCVSSLWRNGKVMSALEIWTRRGVMAIVQMLPKWLWKRTALGRASEVRLQGLIPGVFNQKLIAKEVSLWDELEEDRGIKVPVFTLEPDKVATWAQMLAGRGSIWTLGYVFKLDVTPINKETRLFNLDYEQLRAEQRVQAFRVTASPMARKLAGLLAAAPVITLPIVRLIREMLLKNSQQVHVAEVFLGGLLKPLSEINSETNPDYVQYDFIEEVRELLVDSVPSEYVLNVVDEVSKYVAKKVGFSLENFAAVLRKEKKVKDINDAQKIAYFAKVTNQILKRLGGDYARFADSLESNSLIDYLEPEVKHRQPQLSKQSQLSNSPKYIPYADTANFVGRTQELETLHQELQQQNRVAILAVAGMGGVGKTTLAAQYARQYENDYPGGICWLNARETNLAAEIVQFVQLYVALEVPQKLGGKVLSLTEQVRWCLQHWQPPEGLVLVVLDDVTNLAGYREILPTNNRFRVLMTTRLRNLDRNVVREISLDVLSEEEALQLLSAILGENDKRIEREKEAAKSLCAWLGYLPLGVELVTNYLTDNPDLSLAAMLKRLKKKRIGDEALNSSQWENLSTAQRGVKAAFELSWQELNPIAQLIAEFVSLFALNGFVWEWLQSKAELFNWELEDINEAKKQLYKRHLIQRLVETEGCYTIYPLIREFLQAKLTGSGQANDLRQAFAAWIVRVAQEIPQSPTRELIESLTIYIPHLQEVAENLIDAVNNEDLIWVFAGLGTFYDSQGLYRLAEPWYQQCLSTVQTRLGQDHPDVATSLNNLANLYYLQGRYSEAEPLYLQALELRQRLLGQDHPDVATSLNNLANLYYLQGRYSEAEPLYLQALELRQRLLGQNHPDVATNLNNLANLYSSQGRYSEAEPLYIQALELYQRSLGQDHPLIATNLNNLANLYSSQGRYSEAEPLYQQALELRRRLLGQEHPLVGTSVNNLANLYYSQGRYSEAELLYQQAFKIYDRVLGSNHPDTVSVRNNLAGLGSKQISIVLNEVKEALNMTDKLFKLNFDENDAVLSELLKEVQKWEGTLAGGTKLGINAEKVDSLFQTKISFGNPRDRLIRLTENTFKDSGTELDSIYKQQMQEQFDFYYMTLTVALRPERGATFSRLTCELDFSPKGSNEPVIVSLFPAQKWHSVMNLGVGMDVGLNGNLNWDVGIDSSKLAELLDLIPGDIKANVASKNNFKAFLAIPAYQYNFGHSEILTNGEGLSTCYWRIQDQELQKVGTAQFGIVFKVPKGTKLITLQGTVWAEPDLNWLTADIRDVFANLSENLKQLLKQKNEAASHFARGDVEKWELNLPKG
ncbi:MAG TPA: SAV_2336 N-terminal domain-related protein [Oculatellaceae cyanobacterium]